MRKAFEMLLGPGRSLLVEAPTYSGALAALGPLQVDLFPVAMDSEGVIPEAFEAAFLESQKAGRPARVFYTIPTGQNPSGATTSDARRSAIWELCEKYNILILEDDRPPFSLHNA